MPPQTRGSKVSKASKENIGVVLKTKSKAVSKVTKQRKALADKTNSASDDNSSAEIIRKENCVIKGKNKKNVVATVSDAKSKPPRRERKLPNRFNENELLSNLSITKESMTPSNQNDVNKKAVKNDSTLSLPFKSPHKVDNSLITNRPKRVCRLPSKFDDHSVSPNKFIPVGCYASTPIVQNKNTKSITDKFKVALSNKSDKVTTKNLKQTKLPYKKSPLKIPTETVAGVAPSDSNNNAKHRQLRSKKGDSKNEPQMPAVTGVATSNPNNAKGRQLRAKKVDSINEPQIPAETDTDVAASDSNNNAKQRQLRSKKGDSKNEPQMPAVTGVATSDPNNAKGRQLRAKKVDSINEPQIPAETDTDVAASNSNNNAKHRQFRAKKVDSKNKPQTSEKASPTNHKTVKKKLVEHNFSYRVLEDKQRPSKRDKSHLDVYEFTYDPNEEPPPQKKKRKRPVKKNPPKQKTVVFKNNYDQNMLKALTALKNVVTKKPSESQVNKPVDGQIEQVLDPIVSSVNKPMAPNTSEPVAPIITAPVITVTPAETSKAPPSHPQLKPNASIRVEDIAADFELMDHHDIDYSPVTSPNHGKSPLPNTTTNDTIHHRTNHHDPLNLQDNLSFFDAVPVASSSMNTSVRRPHDSPWRVQFDQLPIKWHVNTYTKPNMTPAVESSFINFNDSNKKKHVYTNLVPESNDPLPEIVSNDQPDLKQTSIISFFREVAEKSASKRKRALSRTPTKGNSVFDDNPDMFVATNRDVYRTPNKTPRKEAADNYWTPNKVQEAQENTDKTGTLENNKNKVQTPKSKNKDGTFFGFDESEDQENVSPVKVDNPRVRALRPRARAVLQEINAQSEPARAKVPLAAKTNVVASSDAVDKVYEEMKSATDAPVFPEKDTYKDNNAITDVGEPMSLQNEDSQSVHLFEDLELVHHLKPLRKSYGKAKKVTFQQTVASDSDTQSLDAPPQYEESDEEDNLADLTFTMPKVAQKNAAKKKTSKKKKQLSKKEKAEMEAWAAQFNSMCEDVEEFPLVVE